jgi:hypothetical protein
MDPAWTTGSPWSSSKTAGRFWPGNRAEMTFTTRARGRGSSNVTGLGRPSSTPRAPTAAPWSSGSPVTPLAQHLAMSMIPSRLRPGEAGHGARGGARGHFPAPLQGEFGPTDLILRPTDPVPQLRESLRRSQEWARPDRGQLTSIHDQLADLVDRYAEDIRRPIDWDYPRVGYPLTELAWPGLCMIGWILAATMRRESTH